MIVTGRLTPTGPMTALSNPPAAPAPATASNAQPTCRMTPPLICFDRNRLEWETIARHHVTIHVFDYKLECRFRARCGPQSSLGQRLGDVEGAIRCRLGRTVSG